MNDKLLAKIRELEAYSRSCQASPAYKEWDRQRLELSLDYRSRRDAARQLFKATLDRLMAEWDSALQQLKSHAPRGYKTWADVARGEQLLAAVDAAHAAYDMEVRRRDTILRRLHYEHDARVSAINGTDRIAAARHACP